jgi:hypothetical protein
MNAELDSRVTASFLESGQILANASHAAAVVAGFGTAAAHSAIAGLLFSSSMLCWLCECWFAVRVAIDASLFRRVADESEDGWRQVDEWMNACGFLRLSEGRSIADRARGAVALWRRQAVALAIQFAILIAAVFVQTEGF